MLLDLRAHQGLRDSREKRIPLPHDLLYRSAILALQRERPFTSAGRRCSSFPSCFPAAAPLAKPEYVFPASQVVCYDSGANSQTPSVVPICEPRSAKSIRVISADRPPSRRPWLILSVAQGGAATFDAYSTRRAIARGAIETDPLMRPFAYSPEIYAAIQVAPVMLDIVVRRMQRSENTLWRRTWWVPQSASTSLFLFSSIHDFQFAKKP